MNFLSHLTPKPKQNRKNLGWFCLVLPLDQEMFQIHGWFGLYSNVQRQRPCLQDQKRGYTAEENGPKEKENHTVTEYPPYEYIEENFRPVATSFGLDIIKDKVSGSVKYPAEENLTEKDDEDYNDDDDDESVIADPQYKFFLEHLRPDGKSYVYDVIEAGIYVKYEPSNPEPEALTACEIMNEISVSDTAIVDTEMHAPAKYEGKRRGRKPKDPELHADKSANVTLNVGGSHVASEARNHAGKCKGREQRGQEQTGDKNPKGSSTSSNHVALKPQNHVPNYNGKRRGRKPKGVSKLHDNKNPYGDSNHVTVEAHKHEHADNQMDKCRGKEQIDQTLSADKNATGNTSSHHVVLALAAYNHALNYNGKHKGRKAKGGQELHATKDPNGNSNHVALEAHKHDHASRRRSNGAKKNVVPSIVGPKTENEIKEESDDDVPHIRRLMPSPVLNVEIFCDDNDEANARKRTKYREKLMEELKKPYCQEEYERLFEDITFRNPAQGQKVLRGSTKDYDKDSVAKSYLDSHIDLKRKIYTTHDDQTKVLNLLRGFFFWLVNVSHEGVFRPWRVQSYLDELLQQ